MSNQSRKQLNLPPAGKRPDHQRHSQWTVVSHRLNAAQESTRYSATGRFDYHTRRHAALEGHIIDAPLQLPLLPYFTPFQTAKPSNAHANFPPHPLTCHKHTPATPFQDPV